MLNAINILENGLSDIHNKSTTNIHYIPALTRVIEKDNNIVYNHLKVKTRQLSFPLVIIDKSAKCCLKCDRLGHNI